MDITIKELKYLLEKLDKQDISDDSKLYIERIEDIYFDKHGWKTEDIYFNYDGTVDSHKVLSAYTVVYKDNKLCFLAHY